MEIRSLQTEFNSTDRLLTGYAGVYNIPATIQSPHGEFREYFAQNAFRENLDKDLSLLYYHNKENVLANTKAGTLTLREDAKGLYFEADLDDDPTNVLANKVRRMIKRKELRHCSFGFKNAKDSWTNTNGIKTREVRSCDLFEISLVVHPAYSATSVNLREIQIQENNLDLFKIKQKMLEM